MASIVVAIVDTLSTRIHIEDRSQVPNCRRSICRIDSLSSPYNEQATRTARSCGSGVCLYVRQRMLSASKLTSFADRQSELLILACPRRNLGAWVCRLRFSASIRTSSGSFHSSVRLYFSEPVAQIEH